MTGRRPLAERMVEAARSLQGERGPESTMRIAVELAVDSIPGCSAAGISLVQQRRQLSTPAYTAELAVAGDQLQYELREGPCLDAIWEEQYVHCADLEREARWPTWAPRVAREHGARSMLCLRLFTRSDTLGALNLYALEKDAFAPQDRDEALALAAHVAIALASAQRADQMDEALDTRTVIAQACGILMERYHLDPDGAFAVLARISSETNRRLRDLAVELVETRRLEGVRDEDRPTPTPTAQPTA